MPVFSAVIGALFYGLSLNLRQVIGIAAAFFGVLLLLTQELGQLSGHPRGVAYALVAATAWALGTHLLRRTRIPAATITISFWMTALAGGALSIIATVSEESQWHMPNAVTWWDIGYQAVLVFGFANTAWLWLARGLPPVASTVSVMFIPVVGVLGGAIFLSEELAGEDALALIAIAVAIGCVLWPAGGLKTHAESDRSKPHL